MENLPLLTLAKYIIFDQGNTFLKLTFTFLLIQNTLFLVLTLKNFTQSLRVIFTLLILKVEDLKKSLIVLMHSALLQEENKWLLPKKIPS